MRQRRQYRLAPGAEVDAHEAAIRFTLDFAHQAALGGALHQTHDSVVALLKELR
jgi:hypothetical protein